jgi:tRNA-specific 2-thiouridylase
MMGVTKKKKVVVAMSGGVDSSVAAALLQEEGYEVIGLTMELWPQPKEKIIGGCCSQKTIQDARQVAEKLAIPFYVVNFRELFEKRVINYFTAEYLRGRTPNPCIACNRYLKFSALLEKTLGLGADYLATGHYARVAYHADKQRYLLLRGEDYDKDQSYVLYNLTQSQLAHLLFPLGQYQKPQIREIALRLGLNVADKPESQEICFIPDHDYKGFLMERVGAQTFKPGNFLNTEGEIIGRHQGLAFYTVGQRKGLGLALGYPVFVAALNPVRNTITVARSDEVFQKGLFSVENNFIALDKLDKPLEVQAKIRYAAQPAVAEIAPTSDGRVSVMFAAPQRAITPGQAVVYYQDDWVVGGGTIDEVLM